MRTPDEPIVLRSQVLVAFCWIVAAGFFVGFMALAASGPGPDPGPVDVIGTAVFGLAMSGLFLRATRMRMELGDQGVTIFRLFTIRYIAWSDLVGAGVDYYGLRLIRTDGRIVTVGSLGKPNYATWLHRHVAADDRVEVVRREIQRHHCCRTSAPEISN